MVGDRIPGMGLRGKTSPPRPLFQCAALSLEGDLVFMAFRTATLVGSHAFLDINGLHTLNRSIEVKVRFVCLSVGDAESRAKFVNSFESLNKNNSDKVVERLF